jgi:hypothetical protein
MEKDMKKKILAIAAATLMSNAAMASSQGNLEVGGTPSSGNLDITLTVNKFIQVTGLDDIDLGSYSGAAVTSQSDSFCVRSNAATFSLTMGDYANGAATGFELNEDGVGTDTIDYTVELSTVDTLSAVTSLGNAVFNTANTGISEQRALSACSGNDNVQVSVSVLETGVNGLAAATAGGYTGHLGILVAPE